MICNFLVPSRLLGLSLLLAACVASSGHGQEASSPDTSAVSPRSAGAATAGETRSSGMAPAAETPSGGTVGATPSPPSIELNEAQQQLKNEFDAEHQKLIDAVGDMREIYIRYMNGADRSPQEKAAYREARDRVRQQMDATYDAALRLSRQVPVEDAVSFMATWIQYRESHDIYNAETFEGAARMLDGGINYLFLFLAAARSAVVSGNFDRAKLIYESIEQDKLEKTDRALMFQLDDLKENWQREQEFLAEDAKNDDLPRVKFSTTRGDIIVELFLDEAPSTVANFITLVDEGFYDGLDFYQVIDHLLALTGDPAGDGRGNSGRFLKDEYDPQSTRPPMRGSLMMAKLPIESGGFVADSASSQFAILFLPLVDSMGQTVFGRVIEGMEVASSLRRVDPTKEKSKNKVIVPPDRILSAEVIRRPEKLPVPEYAPSRD